MLAVHSQIFVVYFYNYIVLLNFEDQATTLSSFDVDILFQDRTFEVSCSKFSKLLCCKEVLVHCLDISLCFLDIYLC